MGFEDRAVQAATTRLLYGPEVLTNSARTGIRLSAVRGTSAPLADKVSTSCFQSPWLRGVSIITSQKSCFYYKQLDMWGFCCAVGPSNKEYMVCMYCTADARRGPGKSGRGSSYVLWQMALAKESRPTSELHIGSSGMRKGASWYSSAVENPRF